MEAVTQIASALDEFQKRFYDWGPDLKLWASHIEIYSDGSGKLVVCLRNTDVHTPRAKFLALADPVQKTFTFDHPAELIQILDNPLRWRHEETRTP